MHYDILADVLSLYKPSEGTSLQLRSEYKNVGLFSKIGHNFWVLYADRHVSLAARRNIIGVAHGSDAALIKANVQIPLTSGVVASGGTKKIHFCITTLKAHNRDLRIASYFIGKTGPSVLPCLHIYGFDIYDQLGIKAQWFKFGKITGSYPFPFLFLSLSYAVSPFVASSLM